MSAIAGRIASCYQSVFSLWSLPRDRPDPSFSLPTAGVMQGWIVGTMRHIPRYARVVRLWWAFLDLPFACESLMTACKAHLTCFRSRSCHAYAHTTTVHYDFLTKVTYLRAVRTLAQSMHHVTDFRSPRPVVGNSGFLLAGSYHDRAKSSIQRALNPEVTHLTRVGEQCFRGNACGDAEVRELRGR